MTLVTWETLRRKRYYGIGVKEREWSVKERNQAKMTVKDHREWDWHCGHNCIIIIIIIIKE